MAWIAALAALAGSAMASSATGSAADQMAGAQAFNPVGFSNPFGRLSFGQAGQGGFEQSDSQDMIRQMLESGVMGNLMGGQFFNNPGFHGAFGQAAGGLQGDFGNAQGLQGLMMPGTAFGGLGGMFGNAQGLNNMFAQNLSGGLRDLSGGMQQGLFGAGANFFNQAGNQQGLIDLSLSAQRAQAQPFEDRLLNRVQNQLFSQGRLGSTGGAQQFGETIGAIQGADTQRILNAQTLGLQGQQQFGQLGASAFGAGNQLFGNNINAFGQQMQGFNQTGQLGSLFEGQGFGQLLQSLQQNQSSGQQRLQNSLGMFGLGGDLFNQSFNQGMAGQGALGNMQALMQQLFLGSLNAEASRIGGASGFSGAMGQNATNQAALMGSLFSGLGDMFGTGDGGGDT